MVRRREGVVRVAARQAVDGARGTGQGATAACVRASGHTATGHGLVAPAKRVCRFVEGSCVRPTAAINISWAVRRREKMLDKHVPHLVWRVAAWQSAKLIVVGVVRGCQQCVQ